MLYIYFIDIYTISLPYTHTSSFPHFPYQTINRYPHLLYTRLGQLFNDMRTAGIVFTIDRTEVLSKIITAAKQVFAGQYAQVGIMYMCCLYVS